MSNLELTFSMMAFIGLVLVGLAFLTILANPGGATERYLDSAGYLFMLPPSAVLSSRFLNGKRRSATVIALAMLAIPITVGLGSPDWAPFENPTFGAVHLTYTGYQEATSIANFVPQNCFVYSDHDIDVQSVALLQGVTCGGPGSYQNTREVLTNLNSSTAFSSSLGSGPGTLFVLSKPLADQIQLLNLKIDVGFSSGSHQVLLPLQ